MDNYKLTKIKIDYQTNYIYIGISHVLMNIVYD